MQAEKIFSQLREILRQRPLSRLDKKESVFVLEETFGSTLMLKIWRGRCVLYPLVVSTTFLIYAFILIVSHNLAVNDVPLVLKCHMFQ